MSETLWLRRIRNYAGLLGALLPWVSLFGAWLAGYTDWKDFSISATYYVTPALPAILTTASVVLMCYDGYSKWDNIVTTVSGVFGLLIVLFPCACSVAPSRVGFFQVSIYISKVIHNASACIFFLLLAYNNLCLFTKGHNRKRNVVYRVCGVGMLICMSLMVLPIHFVAKTWWVEMGALTFFGCSWLTKGGWGLFRDR